MLFLFITFGVSSHTCVLTPNKKKDAKVLLACDCSWMWIWGSSSCFYKRSYATLQGELGVCYN